MKRILLALQFLTIVPVKEMAEVSEKEVGSSSALFPLVGFFEGALFVVSAWLFLKVFPPELSNGLLLFLIVMINGGLHLDGLADTFDAIASRTDKEKTLAIMRDSSIGAIGVTAIILVLLLKYLLLNALFFNASLTTYYASIFLMPVFARWVMVPATFHGKSARNSGLGKIFIENTGLKELITATLLTVLFSVLVIFISSRANNYQFLVVLPLLYIFCIISIWFCNKKFGGMTGDTLGAISETSEILFFMMVVICSQNFI